MLISLLCLTVILGKSGGLLVLLSPTEVIREMRMCLYMSYYEGVAIVTAYGTANVFITRFYTLRTEKRPYSLEELFILTLCHHAN